jgi:hypothetical protein
LGLDEDDDHEGDRGEEEDERKEWKSVLTAVLIHIYREQCKKEIHRRMLNDNSIRSLGYGIKVFNFATDAFTGCLLFCLQRTCDLP